MTREEIMALNADALEARRAEIKTELDNENADLEALGAEIDFIEERKNMLIEKEEQRQAIAQRVAEGFGKVIGGSAEENVDFRNSAEYVNAYANYIKTGDKNELRSVLTQNATPTAGDIPVPVFVEQIIRTAWENEGITSRVRKTYVKGNLKIAFEKSASAAAYHNEGSGAATEETLEIGVVTLIPKTVKKWISISDEVLDMDAEAFLRYIYDEIAYRIAKFVADQIVALIIAAPTTSSDIAPAVANLTAGVASDTIVKAEALLSDEARNNVVIMNKQTWGAFRAITTTDGYLLADPFDGMTVLFNNTLPVYSAATAGAAYAIVGDLGSGFHMNLPAGDGVQFKYDDLSMAEEDLVKIVGRMPVALGVVAPFRFCVIKKAA